MSKLVAGDPSGPKLPKKLGCAERASLGSSIAKQRHPSTSTPPIECTRGRAVDIQLPSSPFVSLRKTPAHFVGRSPFPYLTSTARACFCQGVHRWQGDCHKTGAVFSLHRPQRQLLARADLIPPLMDLHADRPNWGRTPVSRPPDPSTQKGTGPLMRSRSQDVLASCVYNLCTVRSYFFSERDGSRAIL